MVHLLKLLVYYLTKLVVLCLETGEFLFKKLAVGCVINLYTFWPSCVSFVMFLIYMYIFTQARVSGVCGSV